MHIYFENFKFKDHIIYSFETLFRCVTSEELEFEHVSNSTQFKTGIYYGNFCPKDFKGIVIFEGSLFSESYLKKESIPSFNIHLIDDLPALFYSNGSFINNIFYIPNDIIQATFFFVTGYEEIVNSNLEHDNHFRFSVKNRFLYKFCKFKRAVVNEYAEYLYRKIVKFGFFVKPIENKVYAHVSHDVDIPFITNKLIRCVNNLMSNIDMHLINIMHPGIKLIIDIEKKNNIKSSWYFISGGKHKPYDMEYDLCNKKILGLINKLYELNNEIGWHYSYDAAFDKDAFICEANRFKSILRSSLIFGRNHFLRYNIPRSWIQYKNCHLIYDSTLGSAEHEGYIFGICTPFQLFDAIEGKNLDVWELPLIVMDVTLLSKDYRKLSFEEAFDVIKYFVNDVKKHRGVFTNLWHNSWLRDLRYKLDEKLYKEAMNYISKELICMTGNEIISKYKDNVIYK